MSDTNMILNELSS